MTDRASTLSLRESRPPIGLGIAVAVLAVAAITAVIYPLREVAPAVSTGVLYLLVVLLVSTLWGLRLGLATSLLAAAAFNWFHIPPTGRFTVAEGENWIALAMFPRGGDGQHLAEPARVRAKEAEARRIESEKPTSGCSPRRRAPGARGRGDRGRALRRSDELKTALLRAVSHDLRSPLTAIAAAGDALVAGSRARSGRARPRASPSEAAARRLVDKLLDLSRLEAGAAEPRRDGARSRRSSPRRSPSGRRRREAQLSIDADLPLSTPTPPSSSARWRTCSRTPPPLGRQAGLGPRAAGETAHDLGSSTRARHPRRDLERIFEPFYRGLPTPHAARLGPRARDREGLRRGQRRSDRAESLPGQGTTLRDRAAARAQAARRARGLRAVHRRASGSSSATTSRRSCGR